MPIRKGQLYRALKSGLVVEIIRKKGGKWKARVLTEKPGLYNGTHTLAERTIAKCYELVGE